MNHGKQMPLWPLLLVAAFNIVLALIFGNDGFEAFITVLLATALLLIWQSIHLVKSISKSKAWIGLKVISPPFIFVCVLLLLLAVVGASVRPYQEVQIPDPNINWLIVSIGIAPYFVSRILFAKNDLTVRTTLAGWVSILFSITILFIASIGYYDSPSNYKTILLVVASQLLFLMNNIVIKTSYLEKSHQYATNLSNKLGGKPESQLDLYIMLGIVGLPFILPVAIILALLSI